jgi:hypothetical protein
MDEATHRLQQAPASDQIRASMARAVRVLARQAAIKEAKRQLAARGLKPAHYLHREIVVMAEEMMLADAQRRAKIIAEAKAIVARWEAEGYFKPKRAARSVQHLRVMSKEERPATQGLLLNETHAQNGAGK